VSAVYDFQGGIEAFDHAIHGSHSAFFVGEIGLVDEDGFHLELLDAD
jgi:hypothetical protein